MSLGIDLKPTGLKEALRTINSIDPKLRRAYGKQIRELGKVVVDAITPLVPSSSPTRGMDGQWRTGWKNGQTKTSSSKRTLEKPANETLLKAHNMKPLEQSPSEQKARLSRSQTWLAKVAVEVVAVRVVAQTFRDYLRKNWSRSVAHGVGWWRESDPRLPKSLRACYQRGNL